MIRISLPVRLRRAGMDSVVTWSIGLGLGLSIGSIFAVSSRQPTDPILIQRDINAVCMDLDAHDA